MKGRPKQVRAPLHVAGDLQDNIESTFKIYLLQPEENNCDKNVAACPGRYIV